MATTTTMKLTGHDAIDYAARHTLTLSSYTTPIEPAHDGDLALDLAREIVAADPALVYLDLEVATETAEAECLRCNCSGDREMVIGETEHDSLRAVDGCPRCGAHDARAL